MKRRLLLLRHAKSAWDDAGLADHDRPLSPRGWRAASSIGSYLSEGSPPIDLVLCSSARRATQTLEGLTEAGAITATSQVEVDADLYGASTGDLLRRLRAVDPDTRTVLAIGHNPGIGDTALGLIGAAKEPAALATMEAKFPTAALAVLEITAPWAELNWGGATLTAFVTPRSLDDLD